jgi:hypothetical protein
MKANEAMDKKLEGGGRIWMGSRMMMMMEKADMDMDVYMSYE